MAPERAKAYYAGVEAGDNPPNTMDLEYLSRHLLFLASILSWILGYGLSLSMILMLDLKLVLYWFGGVSIPRIRFDDHCFCS